MQKYNGQLTNQFPNSVSGNAAAGAQITVRVKSSGALASLYATDSLSGAALSNPLTADSRGYYGFYAPDGVYTLDVSISGTPQLEIQLQDVASLQDQFNDALANAGYIPIGTFSAGCTVSQSNGVVSDGTAYWRWDGALPKTVTAGSAPTPTGVGGWVLVSDGGLRGDLAAANSTIPIAGVQAKSLTATHQAVSDMVADVNLIAGRICVTKWNNTTSKQGSALYVIKTNAQAAADGDVIDGELIDGILTGANFQLPNSLCAILAVDKAQVTIEHLGGGTLVNRNDAAREKAWNYCGVCRLGHGTYKFNPFAVRSGVSISTPGFAYTTIKIMSEVGNNIGIRVSSADYGVSPGAPIDYWSLRDFQLEDLNSKIPLYVVHGRFFKLDQVYVLGGKVAGAFLAYNFVADIGVLRADACANNGIEFGYDRFGWGFELTSNNVVNVGKLWAYGNGTSLTVRPALSEVANAGAGLVLANGLSNNFGQAYAEFNKGHGIITTAFHGYTISTVYVEANDSLAPTPADQVEFYNNANGASLGDVTYLFGASGSLHSDTALTVQAYRGTRITGAGRVSVYGYYRDAEIQTPATIDVPIFNIVGNRNDVLGANPTPVNFYMSGNFDPFVSTQFSRNGIYSTAPRVVFHDAGTLGTGLELSIFEDGVIKYYHATSGGGAFSAGAFVDFPVLNFTWDKTKTYQFQISGAGSFSGRVQFSINAKLMV